MLRIKIHRRLHIRTGPGTSFRSLGSVRAGQKIDVLDVAEGETHKGNNKWYYRVNDRSEKQYYWAGGATVVETIAVPVSSPALVYEEKLNKAPAPWKTDPGFWGLIDSEIGELHSKGFKGKGVTVAIIDSGLPKMVAPKNSTAIIGGELQRSLCFNTITKKDEPLEDDTSHGSKVSGLIIANDHNQKIFGVAPEAKWLMVKANKEDGRFDVASLTAAFDYLSTQPIHIISISIESRKSYHEIEAAVAKCIQAGKIIVAAAGNSAGEYKNYPACYPPVLSVGAYYLDEQKKRKHFTESSSRNELVSFLAPGKNLRTIDENNNVSLFSETSAATAFAAGTIAAILSGVPATKWPTLQQLSACLPKVCTPINHEPGKRTNMEGYGVLNPIDLLKELN